MKYKALSLAGRCSNGAERGSGVLAHAVEMDSYIAVCGATFGRRSAGWSETGPTDVTCSKCLKKLERKKKKGEIIEKVTRNTYCFSGDIDMTPFAENHQKEDLLEFLYKKQ